MIPTCKHKFIGAARLALAFLFFGSDAIALQFPLSMPARPSSFPLQRPKLIGDLVLAWGDNGVGQTDVPSLADAVQISAGSRHSLALRQDGSIVGWGAGWHGNTKVSPNIGNVIQVSAGSDYSVVLRSDGTAVIWGQTQWSSSLPWQTPLQPDNFTDLVQVSSNHWHVIGLKANGSVVTYGGDYGGVLNVPQGLNDVVQVAAGFFHGLALRANGNVVAWGGQNQQSLYNFSRLNYGQSDVPSDLSGVVQIAAGEYHSVALKADGTVVVWGSNEWGQRDVPPSLSNVVRIASGARHVVAIKADGTIVSWGDTAYNINLSPPSQIPFVLNASAGQGFTIALCNLKAPSIVSQPSGLKVAAGASATFSVSANGTSPSYQWYKNGSPISGATASSYTIPSAQASDTGSYTVTVLNTEGSVTSLAATLTVGPSITSDLSTVSIPKGKLIPRFTITTNFGAKSFAARGLPKGLKLNAKNGVISGKPTKPGTYTVTLTARKMKGKKVEQQATATKVVIVY